MKYHSANGLSRLNFGGLTLPVCFWRWHLTFWGKLILAYFKKRTVSIREGVCIFDRDFGFHGPNWHPWVVNASVGMVFVETWGIPWTKRQSLSSSQSELNNFAWDYGNLKESPAPPRRHGHFLGENIRGISPLDSHGKLWHRGQALCQRLASSRGWVGKLQEISVWKCLISVTEFFLLKKNKAKLREKCWFNHV